jgi:hypothetical protein
LARVVVFDTTLRDGEQSPGIALNLKEKVEIAEQLSRLGVDVIEAGFPIASDGETEAVRAIAATVRGPVIAMLEIPDGYTFDGNVELTMPLTTRKIAAEKAEVIAGGRRLKITFEKGLIDHNIPAGDAVPLTVSANFMHEGLQKKLTSTTHVRVLK